MVYQSGKMILNTVMKVFKGKVNDVEICEHVVNGRSSYYTVLIIKEHRTVKKLMTVMEKSPKEREYCVDMFNCSEGFCVVFEYVKERKLDDFYMAWDISLEQCEDICLNVIVQCMTCGLPFPLLELIIRQRQLHLRKDQSVALGYTIDLEDLDEACTEAKCVMQCALIVRDMLEKKVSPQNIGYKLLTKKIPKQSYASFRELYKDIRLASSTMQKRGLIDRIKAFWARNNRRIYKLLLFVCIVMILLAILAFISRLIWGDVSVFHFLFRTFHKIGTESLIK